MVTRWAGSLRTYVTEQMELSCNCSSSLPDYSEDTFESFSEGEEETCRQYKNDLFESFYSEEGSEWLAVTDPSESTWQSLSQNDEEQEFLDPTVRRRDLIRKWIGLLKEHSSSNPDLAKPTIVPALAGITVIPEEDLNALQSFCATKINRLCRLPSAAPLKRNTHNDRRHGLNSQEPLTCSLNCIVPDQLVNRLHLKNITATVEQLAKAERHQPSRCLHCLEKTAELAKNSFLRRKKTLMEEVLLQEKLEELLYTKDSLTLIGEIHKSLPKLSEDPKNIWWKLNERGLKP